MKLIAHRGNINGPNPELENSKDYIEDAISLGYDVEIDVWYAQLTDSFYLGHDSPAYKTDWYWLSKYINYLWLHCKNIDALHILSKKTSGFNYFWHQNDDYTLTSRGYIWSYPGKTFTSQAVIVLPENTYSDMSELKVYNCYGVCSDYIKRLK